jgi:hypothetical protein
MRIFLGFLMVLFAGCGVLPGGTCQDVGCSRGQLCTDRTDLFSTCEFRPEFSCFAAAGCARQTNGQCGFNQTPALSACLSRVADGGMP